MESTIQKGETPVSVSVCMITYNHEKYIAEAIEGVLLQETDFPVELVISNDASSDTTSRVIQPFLTKQFPNKTIRFFDHKKNLGMMGNAIFTLNECKGKYVAICEGDDYWTDKKKLQKQVTFLEKNPDYVICSHRVEELEDGRKQLSHTEREEKELTYTIEDLAKGNLMYTLSVVYRNHLIDAFPSWFPQSPVGDYVIHMLNARHGKIKYLPETMAVYRKHDQGNWSLIKYEKQLLVAIKTIDFLLDEFTNPIRGILIAQKAGIFSKLAKVAYDERDPVKAKDYLDQAFAFDPSLKDQWLEEYYPMLLTNLFNSRRYKTADKFFSFFNKIPLVRNQPSKKIK